MPTILPAGKALPAIDLGAQKKLERLQIEAEKLRKQIDVKQKAKRASLQEWAACEREVQRDAYRSELAQGQLDRLTGEVTATTAF